MPLTRSTSRAGITTTWRGALLGTASPTDLLELLENRVYVGASAGSMIFSRNLTTRRRREVVGDLEDLHVLGAGLDRAAVRALRLVPQAASGVAVVPGAYDAWADELAAAAEFPVWFIDDDTAIRVRGDEVDVVSEGRWLIDR